MSLIKSAATLWIHISSSARKSGSDWTVSVRKFTLEYSAIHGKFFSSARFEPFFSAFGTWSYSLVTGSWDANTYDGTLPFLNDILVTQVIQINWRTKVDVWVWIWNFQPNFIRKLLCKATSFPGSIMTHGLLRGIDQTITYSVFLAMIAWN